MTQQRTILIVEDDVEMRLLLEEELRDAGYRVIPAADGTEALQRLSTTSVDVVVTDLVMPGLKGHDVLAEVRARDPSIPVVIITAFGSIESAVDSMRAGAYHYVAKPFRIEQLLATVENALTEHRIWRELTGPGEARQPGTVRIVAESLAMRKAVDLTRRAALADCSVLLLGESGTGKELLARVLHGESPRRAGRFLAVNCSAIPENLLESQLFGHRRGSFTDAREDYRGLFLEAEGGTVLLDEIGDMAPPLQAKLLRVLPEKEVQPVGSATPVPVNVCIIAATHSDLDELAREGRFRQDLYYRLNVITVHVPPLRERMEDLLPLVRHLLEKHGARLGRPKCTLRIEALEALRRHDWPGNVRELENVIERALVLGQEDAIGLGDLPPAVRARPGAGSPPPSSTSLAEMEREHVLRTLRAVGGNRAAAARLLAVDRKTLYRKLKQYGIGLR